MLTFSSVRVRKCVAPIHLSGEALNRKLNVKMVHVPQRGEAPVMQDLLSKTVSIDLTSAGLARQHVKAGKVVPLAIMGHDRSPVLPEGPTMRAPELDDPLFEAAVWIAFVAPAKNAARGRSTVVGRNPRHRCAA